MKTIIVKSQGDVKELKKFIAKLEKYTDKVLPGAVICERYLDTTNYNTITGEMKDATLLNDYDLFIVGVTVPLEVMSLQNINKARTFVCELNEYDSAKNYVIMI